MKHRAALLLLALLAGCSSGPSWDEWAATHELNRVVLADGGYYPPQGSGSGGGGVLSTGDLAEVTGIGASTTTAITATGANVFGANGVTTTFTGTTSLTVTDGVATGASFLAPTIDAASAGALTVGAGTATSLDLSATTETTTVKGLFNVDEAASFDAFVNVGSAASAVATGDLAAGDGTRLVFWDASAGTLTLSGATAAGNQLVNTSSINGNVGIHAQNTNAGAFASALFVAQADTGSAAFRSTSSGYTPSGYLDTAQGILATSAGLTGGLKLVTASTAPVLLATNSTTRWSVDGTSGDLIPSADSTYDIGSASVRPALIYADAVDAADGVTLGTDAGVTFDEHASAMGTPAAGNVALYAKADGLLYSKDDAGAEVLVSGGAGSTSFSGFTADADLNMGAKGVVLGPVCTYGAIEADGQDTLGSGCMQSAQTTGTATVDSSGCYFRQTTSATGSDSDSVRQPYRSFTLGARALLDGKFRIVSGTGNHRFFVGACYSAYPYNADEAANAIGLQVRSGDSNFYFFHDAADGTATRVDSGVAVDTAIHTFRIDAADPASVVLTLYDVDGAVEATTTVTTDLPSASTGLGAIYGFKETAASASSCDFFWFHLVVRPTS